MFAALIFLGGLAAVWKAEPLGRALQKLDGGRAGRRDAGFGTGLPAYVFFVRWGSVTFAIIGAIALVRLFLDGGRL